MELCIIKFLNFYNFCSLMHLFKENMENQTFRTNISFKVLFSSIDTDFLCEGTVAHLPTSMTSWLSFTILLSEHPILSVTEGTYLTKVQTKTFNFSQLNILQYVTTFNLFISKDLTLIYKRNKNDQMILFFQHVAWPNCTTI